MEKVSINILMLYRSLKIYLIILWPFSPCACSAWWFVSSIMVHFLVLPAASTSTSTSTSIAIPLLSFPLHLGSGRFLWLSLCYLFSATDQAGLDLDLWDWDRDRDWGLRQCSRGPGTWFSEQGDAVADASAVNEFVRLRSSAFGC